VFLALSLFQDQLRTDEWRARAADRVAAKGSEWRRSSARLEKRSDPNARRMHNYPCGVKSEVDAFQNNSLFHLQVARRTIDNGPVSPQITPHQKYRLSRLRSTTRFHVAIAHGNTL